MGRRKDIYELTSENIGRAANECARIISLYSADEPCPRVKLSEETQLTSGQISTVIKYMRRCSEKDLERYIRFYPISCKRGYFFAKSFTEFAPCFVTLTKWHESLKRTIEPMRTKMEKEGIDWRAWIPEKDEETFLNYLQNEGASGIDEMNKHTSWFMEEDQ